MRRPDVVLVCQRGAQVDSPVKYGAMRAVLEIARHLEASGRGVLLVGLSSASSGLTEGIPFLGARDEHELRRILRRLSPCSALIACSRADVFLSTTASARLVYHHGPHLPEGEFAGYIIRRLRIPVAVVSRDSMCWQNERGVPLSLLRIVRNGYAADVFKPPAVEQDRPRRLVFAGLGAPYKGLDAAVAAFILLKERFADAEFHIYGDSQRWDAAVGSHYWREGWLNPDGTPAWRTIESAVPGLRYCGPVTPSLLARAFQEASLLVMPSRVAETFGIASIEAQACGCLPVLPNQGGFPETMRADVTGYTYAPNTPERLTERITELWLAGLPSVQQRLEASAWVANEFSWARAAHEISEILEEQRRGRVRSSRIESKIWLAATRTKEQLREIRNRWRNGRRPYA
jgi:glycosyltransferase involved in cell wall biosynthesis